MTGLNNTKPHYVFNHALSADEWVLLKAGANSLELLLLEPGANTSTSRALLKLDWVKQEDARNLAFHGCVTMDVAGIDVNLGCAGYIAYGGGVLWIEDGVTPLDDPLM